MYEEETKEAEQEIFRHTANFYYRQGQYEAEKEPMDLTDKQFDELMAEPSTNGYTLDEYKGSKALQSTYETHRNAVMQIQRGEKPQVDDKLLEKQENERLKTGLKISGVIDMLLIGINNRAKVNGIIEAGIPSPQVRFVAVIDNRTTKMCNSLDGQVFNVKGQNTFTRYSDSAGGLRTYTCDGLVKGLNLPPINDHFHWCRSTIIYNIDKPKAEWYDKYVEMKTMFNREP